MKTGSLALLAAVFLTACDSGPPTWFDESAAERGLDFEHVRGRETRYWFPEIMGGGVALLDFDDDGTAGSGAGDAGYGMGCAAGDVNGDGRVDLHVTNVGPNALLVNNGDGTFTDTTASAGVGHPGWGTSCAFFDAELDGDLDLFVVNYLSWSLAQEIECKTALGQDYCSPNNYAAPARDAFYLNDGAGIFSDATDTSGIGAVVGNGLGVSVGDFDGDGWTDVYVANDMMPNLLWMNDGQARFEDRALLAGCAANMDGESEAGMGTVAVDVENDGDLDLFLTHLRDESNTLYVNRGGIFTDRTASMGLATPSLRYTGFGTGFGDFDCDGTLDLYVVNGAVTKNRPELLPGDPYAEPNQAFRGLGDGRFEEIVPLGGLATPVIATSRGAALGDLDDDGGIDLVIVDNHAPVRLLLNTVRDRGHWLTLRVRLASGADALGAAVRIETPDGIQWRTVNPATSYCASNDPRVHFGLGEHGDPVEVVVRWPDGAEERFGPLEVDRVQELRR